MEDKKEILITTLKSLSGDLRRQQFIVKAIRKKRKELNLRESSSLSLIKEIKNRIDYNIKEHKTLLNQD